MWDYFLASQKPCWVEVTGYPTTKCCYYQSCADHFAEFLSSQLLPWLSVPTTLWMAAIIFSGCLSGKGFCWEHPEFLIIKNSSRDLLRRSEQIERNTEFTSELLLLPLGFWSLPCLANHMLSLSSCCEHKCFVRLWGNPDLFPCTSWAINFGFSDFVVAVLHCFSWFVCRWTANSEERYAELMGKYYCPDEALLISL